MTTYYRIGIVPRQLNPKAATTPLALRRICGVCRHFAGERIDLPGYCTRFEADVPGRGAADACDTWARRTAGVDAPPEALRAALLARDEGRPEGARRGPQVKPDVEARRARVRVLAAEGKTLREAAAIIGVSYETVRSDAKAAAIRFPKTAEKLRRPRRVQKNGALRAELVARIAAGDTTGAREIAARHGVKIYTVYAMAARIRREVQA